MSELIECLDSIDATANPRRDPGRCRSGLLLRNDLSETVTVMSPLTGSCSTCAQCSWKNPIHPAARRQPRSTASPPQPAVKLVATCDLAIASDQATFATPGVRIGLFCTTPMVA